MIGSKINFEGIDRTVLDAFALDSKRVLMVLAAEGEPTLAVTGTRYLDSGLFTGLRSRHGITDVEYFPHKVEMLIELGVYD